MILTERFSEALAFADRLHRGQTRKGNDIPYIAHLLAVASTVLEWGGDEDTAIAALLHDAVEDQGGLDTADLIRAKFGDRVADIVLACSDSVTDDPAVKAPWEERKRAYVAKLATASPEIALVVAGDKLHNITALLHDVRRDGVETLSRFSAPPDRIAWYYAAVAGALAGLEHPGPTSELKSRAADLEGIVAARVVP